MEFVKPPDTFNFDEPNTPQRWARWEKQFGTYFVAAELDKKSKQVQVARLLNAAGPDAQEIMNYSHLEQTKIKMTARPY